jgi:hypothetical protein
MTTTHYRFQVCHLQPLCDGTDDVLADDFAETLAAAFAVARQWEHAEIYDRMARVGAVQTRRLLNGKIVALYPRT